jgi:3-phenylpropionate/trans-cinnamate dioxygenase ferredoxin reductase subunit
VPDRIVVVGGGVAAQGAVSGLRRAGHTGEVVLIGDEEEPPYQRPPLSKRYLVEELPRSFLHLPTPDCELRLGDRVEELEPDAHRVRLAGGDVIEYSSLLLATGSRPRTLPGYEGAGTLRRVEDAERLRSLLNEDETISIIGAGFIGCEVAAAARAREVPVRVHDRLDQPMERVLGPELGDLLAEHHRRHGVELRLGSTELPEPGERVLVAVGTAPNQELAERAGIDCDGGVLVDEYGRSSAPGVFAAGDCARFHSPHFGDRIRIEHFQTAQRHGTAIGRVMAGDETPFAQVPWFWSDQYDLNLQYLGGGLSWDRLVFRGSIGDPTFTAFQLHEGRVRGVLGWNDGRTVSQIRRLMDAGVELDPEKLADPTTDLKQLGR